jgi:Putative Flp pilus-assembly TadE/G-like
VSPARTYRSEKPSIWQDERGAIAALAALALAALMGIAALSIDLGRAFVLESELQQAADAAAIACASQLDGQPGEQVRARDAARTLITNQQTFGAGGATVAIEDANITFPVVAKFIFTDLHGGEGYSTGNHCRVEIAPRQLNFFFAGIVGAPTGVSATAVAVAAMRVARCQISPLMVCNNPAISSGGTANLATNADAYRGRGMTLKYFDNGVLPAPGDYGFVATANEGIAWSATAIRGALGRINPNLECLGEKVSIRASHANAVRDGLNMRFDIYPTAALRDDPTYAPAENVVKGLRRSDAQCHYDGAGGWDKPATPYAGPGSSPAGPAIMGFPRDNCAYQTGGASCNANAGGKPVGTGAWDRAKYIEINHATGAPVPNSRQTRYEVYRWEIESGVLSQAAAAGERPNRQCGAATPPAGTPDRRVITMTVFECGATLHDFKALGWIDVFLTEPVAIHDGAGANYVNDDPDLHVEIIGQSAPQTRSVVRLVD